MSITSGASEGKGLGNKFLDDLRQADILLHIIDVSGTTNEKVNTSFCIRVYYLRFKILIREKRQKATIPSTTSSGSIRRFKRELS
jgi:GTPase involved in cell partitioning and DNA repair